MTGRVKTGTGYIKSEIRSVNWQGLFRRLLVVSVYLIVFSILDWVTHAFEISPGIVAWYPPAGLGFALLLALGEGFIPAVAIASLISSIFIYRLPYPLIELIGWASILSITYGVAAWMLRRRVKINPQLRTLRDISWLILTSSLATFLLTLISSSKLNTNAGPELYDHIPQMFRWWTGEIVGVLVVTPFLMIHVMPWVQDFLKSGSIQTKPFANRAFQLSARSIWKIASLVFTLLLAHDLMDNQAGYSSVYLLALPLLWIVLENGLPGTTLGLLVVNFGITLGLKIVHADLSHLGEMQLVMLGFSATGLWTGSVVSDQKRSEISVRQNQERFRSLIENGLDNISLLDAEGLLLWESPTTIRTLGYSQDEHLGKNTFDLIHPDDLIKTRQLFVELVHSPGMRKQHIFRLRHKDGSWRWIEAVATNLLQEPNTRAIVLNYRDISERIQAEAELHRIQKKYQSIFEGANEGIYQSTYEGKYITANPALARMFGFASPEELIAAVSDINTQFYVDLNRRKEFMRIMEEYGRVNGFESEIQCKDGGTMWVSENAHAIKGENGEFLYFEGTTQDISDRKRAEVALLASEANYRLLFENNPLPMWVYDVETLAFLEVNDAAVSHYGYTREEFLRMTIQQIRPKEELSRLRENLVTTHEKRQYSGPWKHLKKDGTVVEVEISSNELSLTGKPTRLVLVRDVTDRIRAEQAIRQRLSELEAVNRISTTLRSAETLDAMLPILLDETLAIMGSDAGTIKLFDPLQEVLVPVVSRGWYKELDDIRIKPGEGASGKVFSTGEPYLTRDFRQDLTTPRSVLPRLPEGWGGACVPIRTTHTFSGVLFVAVPLPRELTNDDVKLLTTIAEIAGNAIQRTRLFDQTEKQLRKLEALRAIDEAISTSFDLQVTLNILLGYARQELGVDAACILRMTPHLQILEHVASQGFRSRNIERSHLRIGEGLAGRAVLERRAVHSDDLSLTGTHFTRSNLLANEKLKIYHGVPLIIKGEVKGVLEIFHSKDLVKDQAWEDFLDALAGQAAIAIDNAELFEGLTRSNIELSMAYDATIEGWSKALDLRDKETEGHTERVTELTMKLARVLGFSDSDLVQVRRGAMLHDIGKMGVPDAILLKPDKLNEEEWSVMRKHPSLAYDMLSPVQYLRIALEIAYCHHEKWDGSGYPRGLKGEHIPLAARIFAIADVWDSLLSDRPYRKAWKEHKVRDYIKAQAGKHFDPQLVEGFLAVVDEK